MKRYLTNIEAHNEVMRLLKKNFTNNDHYTTKKDHFKHYNSK